MNPEYENLWMFIVMWLALLGGFAGAIALAIKWLTPKDGRDSDKNQIQQ